jgi:hypothetical protein
VKRIKERKDSLKELRRFASNLGFEGWLKVEVIAALGKRVQDVRNKGADILLEGGLEIELKGANNLSPSWIGDGALKYQTPCLFIGDGSSTKRIQKLESDRVGLIGYKIFNDGRNDWVIGIVAPKNHMERWIDDNLSLFNIRRN